MSRWSLITFPTQVLMIKLTFLYRSHVASLDDSVRASFITWPRISQDSIPDAVHRVLLCCHRIDHRGADEGLFNRNSLMEHHNVTMLLLVAYIFLLFLVTEALPSAVLPTLVLHPYSHHQHVSSYSDIGIIPECHCTETSVSCFDLLRIPIGCYQLCYLCTNWLHRETWHSGIIIF